MNPISTQNHRVGLDPDTAPEELAALVACLQHLARAHREGNRLAAVSAAHQAEQTARALTDRLLSEISEEREATRRELADALGLSSHGPLNHRIKRHRNRED